MVKEGIDPFVAEASSRRALSAAMEDYAVQTQQTAVLSVQTKIVDMDTGEVSYITLSPDGSAAPVTSTATSSVAQSRPVDPPIDADTAFRRARLGVVAVVVLVLLWVWLAQRRAH